MKSTHVLWYDKPASVWTEALPIGNGRIGAMVFGSVENERIALNEDTLWSGYPSEYSFEGGPEALKEARKLLDKGKLAQAEKLIEEKLTGRDCEAYMPLGDLLISGGAKEYTSYKRSLDMTKGVSSVKYISGGASHEIMTFVTFGQVQGLVYDHLSEKPDIECEITLNSKLMHYVYTENGRLCMETECPSHMLRRYAKGEKPYIYNDEPEKRGIRALTLVSFETDGGEIKLAEDKAIISGAKRLTLQLSVRTSFNGYNRHPFIDGRPYRSECLSEIKELEARPLKKLLGNCNRMFSKYMNRVDLVIHTGKDNMPTDKRLEAFDPEVGDKVLSELLFNYGRYLTVAGSQPGTQAMNLQGIWNEQIIPPWNCNYTTNINTEMNYYPAETANMGELAEPLFALMENLRVSGRDTAKMFYGAGGSVVHHNSDIWALSNPVGDTVAGSAVWAFWPMGLAWMCNNLYAHYQYTLDERFLKDKALIIMRDALTFLLDFMTEDKDGYFKIYPATSPENTFIYKGKRRSVARAGTMLNSITRELITNYMEACEILGEKDDIYDRAAAVKDRIYPYKIGSKGQILEWDEEYEEAEPHHRHTSHLYGLHPGHEISDLKTPELADAARRTLELRGDDGTGWSLGWKICFWARLNDGDHALKLLNNQLRLVRQNESVALKGGTYPNMFDAHPPFQIDGNFGSCAGIAEMFVQSLPHSVTLLPALPKAWDSGSVSGLKAMGDITVDIAFENGKLRSAKLKVEKEKALPVHVYCGGKKVLTIDRTGEYEI